VDRLERAVELAWETSRVEPLLRAASAEAKQAWAEAEALRWRLAMSGRRIAHGEARKLAGPFLDEADLVQEGYIGLLRAAKRFRPRPRHPLLDLRPLVGARPDDPRHRPHRPPRAPAGLRRRTDPQPAQSHQTF
jgi:hypothetical protein